MIRLKERHKAMLMGGRWTLLLIVAAAVLAWVGWATGASEGGKGRHGKKTADEVEASLGPLGSGEPMAAQGVAEPSGIVFHPARGHFFVVGDEGTLAELDAKGDLIGHQALGENLEDVTVYTPTGDLLLLSEKSASLILYDPAQGRERKRWQLDDAALIGNADGHHASPNHGFEGLAFREDRGHRSGGLLYLAHQTGPPMVLELTFDATRPPGTLGGDSVRARWPLKGYKNVTAVTYVPGLDRLLVIADEADRLLVLGPDGHVQRTVQLPGVKQEGLCFDPQGTLWITDDRAATLFRFPGALDVLRAEVAGTGSAGKEKVSKPHEPR